MSDGTATFTYDAENRLVTTASGATLTYDPMGRLYAVATTAATESYAYAGDQRVAEYGTTGMMTARYVFGSGEDNPLFRKFRLAFYPRPISRRAANLKSDQFWLV